MMQLCLVKLQSILEGSTDIQLYKGVAEQLDRDIVLRPVELIDGFGEGCKEVIRLIDELEAEDELKAFVKKNVVGLIDKDVRDFRNEHPLSECVLTLKYYSIESHYVCSSVLVRCLVEATYAPQDSRLVGVAEAIHDSFPARVEPLYLGSIDALMASLDANHEADFRYSDGFGRLRDINLVERLMERKSVLSDYAESNGLSMTIDSLKCFSKGKVLLDCYCDELKRRIDGLTAECGVGPIQLCEYCASGIHNKCWYRAKTGVTTHSLKNSILAQFPFSEFNYLIDILNNHLKVDDA